jgi:hypothetical protein
MLVFLQECVLVFVAELYDDRNYFGCMCGWRVPVVQCHAAVLQPRATHLHLFLVEDMQGAWWLSSGEG